MNSADFAPILTWVGRQQSRMVEHTIELARINSGTFNAAGVNSVGERLLHWFEPLAAQVERLPLPPVEQLGLQGHNEVRPLGQALRLRLRPEAPRQIFLGGHLDTVYAADDPFQQVSWQDPSRLHGPGVADMKGGLVIMLIALMALEQHPLATGIGWEVLLNPDEEIGSPCSATLIADAASRCQLGLLYEPALPDGSYAGQRKGSGNFSVLVKGRSAHAGRNLAEGRNAVRALADFISALDDLNGLRPGVSVNPAFMQGGGPVNQVPDSAMARFNIRIQEPEDERWCHQQLARLSAGINGRDGLSLTLQGGFGRKPKLLSSANLELFDLLRECAHSLELPMELKATGGCCDGNNLAAAGVPNIDTLGAEGGAIHSSSEFLLVESLSRRAALSARLLLELAAGRLDSLLWPSA